ncbi:enoyl-CoA hydratase [Kordiimonas aquimaris]|uniref:enoyl-CoA hydratase n=1 Tax=Kordiimonas aquimaris TaxID=707591 RepID=UPI0021CFA91E|nr:enoyl-CoA hydratase [Kordiimonas aquimaris]
MSDHILVSVEDRIMTITFNRPEKKNAITSAMYGAMADALLDANGRDDVRTIMFTANGDAFTAGNDLIDFRDNPPRGPEAGVARFLKQITVAEKPIVAAVNGMAVGVGLTMLLHFDFVYMADSAKLQAPFVDLALVPEAASSLLLPKRIGHVKAAEIFMLGKWVNAEEASSMGMACGVFKADELNAAARKTAILLTKKAPESLKQTKRLMRGDLNVVSARMEEESELFSARLQSPELMEAVMAFLQKREPDFG